MPRIVERDVILGLWARTVMTGTREWTRAASFVEGTKRRLVGRSVNVSLRPIGDGKRRRIGDAKSRPIALIVKIERSIS